jgi:hypothetical protein
VVIDDVPYSFRLKRLLERCLDKLLAPGSDTFAVEINSHAHLSGGSDYQEGEHVQNGSADTRGNKDQEALRQGGKFPQQRSRI